MFGSVNGLVSCFNSLPLGATVTPVRVYCLFAGCWGFPGVRIIFFFFLQCMYLSHLFPCLNNSKNQLANRKGGVDKTNSHLRNSLNLSDNKQPQVFLLLFHLQTIESLNNNLLLFCHHHHNHYYYHFHYDCNYRYRYYYRWYHYFFFKGHYFFVTSPQSKTHWLKETLLLFLLRDINDRAINYDRASHNDTTSSNYTASNNNRTSHNDTTSSKWA